jgi:hypothetical protein
MLPEVKRRLSCPKRLAAVKWPGDDPSVYARLTGPPFPICDE